MAQRHAANLIELIICILRRWWDPGLDPQTKSLGIIYLHGLTTRPCPLYSLDRIVHAH